MLLLVHVNYFFSVIRIFYKGVKFRKNFVIFLQSGKKRNLRPARLSINEINCTYLLRQERFKANQ